MVVEIADSRKRSQTYKIVSHCAMYLEYLNANAFKVAFDETMTVTEVIKSDSEPTLVQSAFGKRTFTPKLRLLNIEGWLEGFLCIFAEDEEGSSIELAMLANEGEHLVRFMQNGKMPSIELLVAWLTSNDEPHTTVQLVRFHKAADLMRALEQVVAETVEQVRLGQTPLRPGQRSHLRIG